MKTSLATTACILLLSACLQNRDARVSGRVEGRDSVIIFRLDDRDYRLPVDANGSFSGAIPLRHSAYAYARLLPSRRRVFLFLGPRETLEIIINNAAAPAFEGSLGAINNYLSEQGEYLPLDAAALLRDEESFVANAEESLRVRTLLLEAKNLGQEFTAIESKRLGYLAAEHATRYLAYARARLADTARRHYRPGCRAEAFLARFPVDDSRLSGVSVYLQFVLAYYTFQLDGEGDIRDVMADIQQRVKTRKTRDYLLTELASRHIFVHGTRDGDYLLSLCRREVKDTARVSRVERVADRWRKLSAGATAPDIALRDPNGVNTRLREMRGSYLYIVAADSRQQTWRADSALFRALQTRYAGRDVRFLSIALEPGATLEQWRARVADSGISWEHFMVVDWANFQNAYIISSLPRYIFIDPRGRIVNALAPPPARIAGGLFANAGL
ncbi:MAG: hypothetical protein LBI96_05995 [Odoribacteraceae bacterium]|nr:hypothetical protein [Odoribacteraceae bacterium]